jgi:hypothetical protein
MKYAVEMGSGAMIYTSNFWHSNINRRGDSQTRREHGDLINLILFL